MDLVTIFFRLRKYLRYWLLAEDKHALQSPFLFDWYTKALKCRVRLKSDDEIERIRAKLKKSNKVIKEKHGAGSKISGHRKVSTIAGKGISSWQDSALLQRIIIHFQAANVLELGTSLGINTMYMAGGDCVKELTTVEADVVLHEIAHINFHSTELKNVRPIRQDIDAFLSEKIKGNDQFDLVFLDANHTYEATMCYFKKLLSLCENGLIIIDDINWSSEMGAAWAEIKSQHPEFLTIENFHLGMIFTTNTPVKGNYILSF